MKVYGHPYSTCTRKVLTALAEKEFAAEFVTVDITKGEQKRPEYLAMHPFGVVPVLEDGDLRMYESRAIVRYLDRRLPGALLTPQDLPSYGRMEQWISVEQSYVAPGAMKIVMQAMFGPMRGQTPDQAIIDKGRVELAHALDVLDKALAQQPFLAGDQFSLAEICYLPYLEYVIAAQHGDVILERQHVASWWQKISTRPSWLMVTGKSQAA